MSILISLGVRFYGSTLVSAFIEGGDEKIVHIGQQYLMISTFFYFFLSCIFIARNALQGMGRTIIPLLSGVIELVMRSVAAFYLAKTIGYIGIFWAGPIAWLGGGIVVCVGYWVVIRGLKPRDMREIFTKKHLAHQSGNLPE